MYYSGLLLQDALDILSSTANRILTLQKFVTGLGFPIRDVNLLHQVMQIQKKYHI